MTKRAGLRYKKSFIEHLHKEFEICKQRVKESGLEEKVEFVKCSKKEIPLPDSIAERVLMANLLHELLYPSEFLSEVKRISKPNAQIILIDWHPVPSPTGPPIEERISEDKALELLENNGFLLMERLNVFPYHYFLIGSISSNRTCNNS